MSPTKQEEYDASKEPFDTKVVYIAIEDAEQYSAHLTGVFAALRRAAYNAARALEEERLKTQRLEAKLARWEKADVGSAS